MTYIDKQSLLSAAIKAIDYLTEAQERSADSAFGKTDPPNPFDEDLPDKGKDALQTIEIMNQFQRPEKSVEESRNFGSLRGVPEITPLAANWLAGAWSGAFYENDIVSVIEKVVERWITTILPVSKDSFIHLVDGVVMANFHALSLARTSILDNLEWDTASLGLTGSPPIKIVIGEDASPAILKSIAMLGFGADRLVYVPTDRNGCMRTDLLPALNSNTILCLQAGNGNSGGIDSGKVIAIARKQGAWVHVDGTSGLWAGACIRKRALTKWYEYADSWVTNTQTWLGTPSDTGIVITRHGHLLRRAFDRGGYHHDQAGFVIMDNQRPDVSVRLRALEMWAAMRTLGKSGIDERVSRFCVYAELFGHRLEHAGFEVLNEIEMNQVLFSFGSDEETIRVIKSVQASGVCWVDQTWWKGRVAMRITVASDHTTESDVTRSCMAIIKAATTILKTAA